MSDLDCYINKITGKNLFKITLWSGAYSVWYILIQGAYGVLYNCMFCLAYPFCIGVHIAWHWHAVLWYHNILVCMLCTQANAEIYITLYVWCQYLLILMYPSINLAPCSAPQSSTSECKLLPNPLHSNRSYNATRYAKDLSGGSYHSQTKRFKFLQEVV
jgi:hypothetical protein